MTNSTKKQAKASRDNLDLDLDARLDQARSTLPSIDDEPPIGDAIDQLLAHAKKELDANNLVEDSSQTATKIETTSTEIDDFIDDLDGLIDIDESKINELTEPVSPLKSNKSTSMSTLESQLSAAMEPSVEPDENVNNLLRGTGYDFESLLGGMSDELTPNETTLNEDSLLAAIDELLGFDLIESDPKIESEISLDDLNESVESPDEHSEPEENELNSDLELTVDPDAALAELDAIDEIKSVDSTGDELDSAAVLTVEPEVVLGDLIETVPFEDILAIQTNDSGTETDDIFEEEFNDFDDVADIAAPLVEISTSLGVDDLATMQQLDGLNDAMENKNDAAGFDLLEDDAAEKEQATPVNKIADEISAKSNSVETSVMATEDDDWLKQLDDLEGLNSEETAVIATEEPKVNDDDDWMKQLEGLDSEEVTATEEPKINDDDDWMKQLEGLDSEEVTAIEEPKENDDDDWMKQLEGLEEHDEDTAKMLMDAGHDTVVDHNFNIADDTSPNSVSNTSNELSSLASHIDEDALIAKATEMAISQIKGDQEASISQLKDTQEHVLSQLRADQDGIESKNRKQFADVEKKRKKSAVFGYAALGVGLVGLIGSGVIGYLSYDTKNDTEVLTQSVTALEEKVDTFLAKNPEKEKEIATIKASVEQLNQKVEKLTATQVGTPTVPAVEPGKVNSPVDLLNGKKLPVSTSPTAGTKVESNVSTTATVTTDNKIVPPVDIAPEHPIGESKAEQPKLADMAKKSADDIKVKANAAAKAETDKAKEKADAVLLAEKIAKATAIAKAAASSSKTEDQRKLLTEKSSSRYNGRMTRGMARGGITKEERNADTNVAKTRTDVKNNETKNVLNAVIKPQKAVAPAGKYSVNVISYQQEWFAQSKAAEFRQKGIPVEVAPVDINNYATRYRLKVSGFKTKSDADTYAAKIKKSYNLNETWVSN